MKENTIIIEMTPFLFEDGKTYYFDIKKRYTNTYYFDIKKRYTNTYHNLFIYKKVETVIERKTWFGLGPTERSVSSEIVCINENSPALVNINLDSREIKREIKNVITANQAFVKIKDWDGFVGDIPEDTKTALARDVKLTDLGIK